MENTLTYSDKAKGWTSFHSFIPDWMAKINNRFFSAKNGQLYLHNDNQNPVRNNFYGVQYPSKITTIFNDGPSNDKIFNTIILEGNRPWHANIKTNLGNSTIDKEEFNSIESRHFAYIRKNEKEDDYTGHAAQGVGVIISQNTNFISFSLITDTVSVGDVLFQLNGEAEQKIGIIKSINNNIIEVFSTENTPTIGLFSFAKKDARIEGGEIRGYYLEVELINDETQETELFAINTNAIKSYV